ncbi:MAG: M28 family metallopeptidase [Bryobacteraceae bacterium]
MRKRFFVAVLCAATAVAATDWNEAGKQWWSHVEYLASDQMGGRDVGSPGFEKAAAYVAEQFERAGLQPGGEGNYFQRVQFTKISLDPAKSSIAIEHGGRTTPVAIPGEAQLGYTPDSAPSLTAPVVFAGYGLRIPEAHFDDMQGLNVKGAIVAFLMGGPGSIDGNLRSHYSSQKERWNALREAGAVGMISIANPKDMEIPWARQGAAWGRPRVNLADPSLVPTHGMKFSATWDPAKADDLFSGSGHTFAEIVSAAQGQKPLPHFKLACQIKAVTHVTTEPLESKNVVGIRAGNDPKLKDQYVVISAHLDHIGTGKPVNGDGIYNGAMDDASGVASVIEIAKRLGKSKQSIGRSILFVTVTGEEKGELGSEFIAGHPTVKGKVVADLNMDMFLPLFPLKWLEVQGLNESTLGDDVRAVAQAAGVKVQADKEPNRNRFIRSDQYSFVKEGVPAVAFKFGYVPGDPEEKIFKDWYTNRYHGVADDLNQPVDRAAAAQFDAILLNLAVRVANAPQPPAWKDNSFFRRFAHARSSD